MNLFFCLFRTQINFTVAIDFTASNGEPLSKHTSIHTLTYIHTLTHTHKQCTECQGSIYSKTCRWRIKCLLISPSITPGSLSWVQKHAMMAVIKDSVIHLSLSSVLAGQAAGAIKPNPTRWCLKLKCIWSCPPLKSKLRMMAGRALQFIKTQLE